MNETTVFRLGRSTLRLVHGDIVASGAQVLVSSDDAYLSMGGGVSYSILRGAGDSLRREAAKHPPLEVGDVVVTSAGKLPALHVFHAVTIGQDGRRANEAEVDAMTTRCLLIAESMRIRSIAF